MPDSIFSQPAKITNLIELPCLPSAVLEIMCLKHDDKRLTTALLTVLEKATFLGQIIKIANSSSNNLDGNIDSISEAIAVLGPHAVREMAIIKSIHDFFGGRKKQSDLHLLQLWRHSLKCAFLAKQIAETHNPNHADEAFLSGLLHDMGQLILWNTFGAHYKILLENCGEDEGLRLEMEAELLATHSELGARLLCHWKLNSFMADAVLYHHEPPEHITTALPLVQMVHMANTLSSRTKREKEKAFECAQNVFELSKSQIEEFIGQAEKEAETIALALDIEIPDPPKEAAHSKNPGTNDDSRSENQRRMSLLTGILFQKLALAETRETLLEKLHHAIQSLFNVDQVIFFLREFQRDWLTGKTFAQGKDMSAINGLYIPMQIKESLLIRCLSKKEIMDSFSNSQKDISVVLDHQLNSVP